MRRRSGLGTRALLPLTMGIVSACGPEASARTDDGSAAGVASPTDAILIAHRGASAYAPEHTRQAYELALAMGADFIEPDLQITSDGQLVALHDLTLERTTNARDVFPGRFREETVRGQTVRRWYVNDFTLDEIRTLDAGTWFHAGFAGARVPTFGEVIEIARGRAGLIPETKAPEVYGDLGFSMERLVADELERFGLGRNGADPSTPVIVQSFSAESLEVLRHVVASDLPSTFLISGPESDWWLSGEGLDSVATFATGIGPTKQLLLDYSEAVALAHDRGLTVIPWTFGSDDTGQFASVDLEMAHFIYDLGVDGLFTNNPDLFPRVPPTPAPFAATAGPRTLS